MSSQEALLSVPGSVSSGWTPETYDELEKVDGGRVDKRGIKNNGLSFRVRSMGGSLANLVSFTSVGGSVWFPPDVRRGGDGRQQRWGDGDKPSPVRPVFR